MCFHQAQKKMSYGGGWHMAGGKGRRKERESTKRDKEKETHKNSYGKCAKHEPFLPLTSWNTI